VDVHFKDTMQSLHNGHIYVLHKSDDKKLSGKIIQWPIERLLHCVSYHIMQTKET
jgi:hypothetical protein